MTKICSKEKVTSEHISDDSVKALTIKPMYEAILAILNQSVRNFFFGCPGVLSRVLGETQFLHGCSIQICI